MSVEKEREGARKGAEKIGSLIACRKRQWYVMLCEAVLESIGENGWRPDWPGDGLVKGACQSKLGQKVVAQIGRSADHPRRSLLAWQTSQLMKQTVVKTG
ncbi:MAG: hypothetical protein ABSF12_08080 [Bryobacteraceae bacterium]